MNIRDENGKVILRRKVSTEPVKVRAFFAEFREQAATDDGYLAILEVCVFNDWLLALLKEYWCRETVLVQCDQRSKNKTDSRDANHLGELLWVNRLRIANGERLQNVRRVQPASPEDAAARQITSLRQSLGKQLTRVLNRIAGLHPHAKSSWRFYHSFTPTRCSSHLAFSWKVELHSKKSASPRRASEAQQRVTELERELEELKSVPRSAQPG